MFYKKVLDMLYTYIYTYIDNINLELRYPLVERSHPKMKGV